MPINNSDESLGQIVVTPIISFEENISYVQVKIDMAALVGENSSAKQVLIQNLKNSVSRINGAILWEEIQTALLKNQPSNEAFDSLSIFKGMHNHGIELLKNSLDAFSAHLTANKNLESTLLINIKLHYAPQGTKITLTYTDNAGGFPDGYLETIAKYIDDQGYEETVQNDYVRSPNKEFGGRGRGMKYFIASLKRGRCLTQAQPLIGNLELGNVLDSSGNKLGAQIVVSYDQSAQPTMSNFNPRMRASLFSVQEPQPAIGDDVVRLRLPNHYNRKKRRTSTQLVRPTLDNHSCRGINARNLCARCIPR